MIAIKGREKRNKLGARRCLKFEVYQTNACRLLVGKTNLFAGDVARISYEEKTIRDAYRHC